MIPAHPMNTPARRRRRRTDIDPFGRGPVRRSPESRPGEQLPKIYYSTVDVPADIIRVIIFQLSGVHHMPGQDTIPETGGKPLHLFLYYLRHIFRRTIGHMTIGPTRMFALRRAGGIEDTLLGKQYERPLRVSPLPG